MKHRILAASLFLSILLSLFSIGAFAAEGKVAYVSSGKIDGVSTVYTSVSDAVKALGTEGGTVYIAGLVKLSGTIGDEKCGPVVIRSYQDNTKTNILSIENCEINSSISLGKVGIAPCGEKYMSINNGATFEISKDADGVEKITGLRAVKSSKGGYTFINNNAAAGGVIWWATIYNNNGSELTVDGDTNLIMNGGKTMWMHVGGKADGASKLTINGNTYVTISGGEITSANDARGSGLQTGGSGGNEAEITNNGNTVITINGGKFGSGIGFGSGHSDVVKSQGNVAIIINGSKYGKTDNELTIYQLKYQPKNENRSDILILNNSEDFVPDYKDADLAGIEYILNIKGGSAKPVFAKAKSGSFGKLLGFEIKSDDNTKNAVMLNGTRIHSKNGVYTIPASAGKTQNITFEAGEPDPTPSTSDVMIAGVVTSIVLVASCALIFRKKHIAD